MTILVLLIVCCCICTLISLTLIFLQIKKVQDQEQEQEYEQKQQKNKPKEKRNIFTAMPEFKLRKTIHLDQVYFSDERNETNDEKKVIIREELIGSTYTQYFHKADLLKYNCLTIEFISEGNPNNWVYDEDLYIYVEINDNIRKDLKMTTVRTRGAGRLKLTIPTNKINNQKNNKIFIYALPQSIDSDKYISKRNHYD